MRVHFVHTDLDIAHIWSILLSETPCKLATVYNENSLC